MPNWLCKQLEHAYRMKNLRQIKLLNDCWFFYRLSSQVSQVENHHATPQG
ncbi:cortex morphogenetic protein CmpA [Marinicrinis sediminis]|uniref:Cortex morphogenetic protein CmpA n=1 Tax=Marinicrinis sediminis TaxID=1652465 RepID=A0ABW5R6X5_9BACL